MTIGWPVGVPIRAGTIVAFDNFDGAVVPAKTDGTTSTPIGVASRDLIFGEWVSFDPGCGLVSRLEIGEPL